MDQEDDGILAAFKREPDQAWFLLKVLIGGAVGIVVWNVASSFFLPIAATLGVMLLLILAYAGYLASLIARLVKAMDRWQVEAARQAARLATGRHLLEPAASEGVPLAMPSSSFQQAYFLLRLDEEVKQARMHGHLLSLIAIDVNVPHEEMTPELTEKVGFEVARIASDHAQTISLPLNTGGSEFIFCLPRTDGKGVKTFTSHLVTALGRYWCHFGIVTYPDDGTDAETLFRRAREACELSRQDRDPAARRVASVA